MSLKPDELELLKYVAAGFYPRDAAKIIGMHWKRSNYLCLKWTRKKWYSHGVSSDLGWLEPLGLQHAYYWWFCPVEDRVLPGSPPPPLFERR